MPRPRLDALLGAAIPLRRRDPRPDAVLLSRFLNDRDQAAFEALLVRHAAAVRAACRGWLRSEADIDDAAQATFLVLVQRAGSIRDRAAVGRWLSRVAVNVARRLRRQSARFSPMAQDVPGREPVADDGLRDLLAEEVAKLPEKYRLPVQLCYSAGLTTAEAARRLSWPKGTVLTRLAWARQQLRKSLVRRGVSSLALAGLAAPAPSAVRGAWVCATARAAAGILAGESPARVGVSGRVVILTEGVVRAMMWDRLKYGALAALLTVSLVGFGVGQWSSASAGAGDGRPQSPAAKDPTPAPSPAPLLAQEKVKADEARPAAPGRRREAVIRLPAGTFVKEVDATPYGSGRLTWTYEEDRVLGLIEASVLGGQVELATEAEYSLSSNGTIYGILTSARINHLRLPDTGELAKAFAELKPFVGLWPAVEPLVNEVTTDLPFSYQFRLQGDRLVISNFRILLAGPNPLGKLGGVAAKEAGAVLLAFQALGTAFEGTYTSASAKERPTPNKRPPLRKPVVRAGEKADE